MTDVSECMKNLKDFRRKSFHILGLKSRRATIYKAFKALVPFIRFSSSIRFSIWFRVSIFCRGWISSYITLASDFDSLVYWLFSWREWNLIGVHEARNSARRCADQHFFLYSSLIRHNGFILAVVCFVWNPITSLLERTNSLLVCVHAKQSEVQEISLVCRLNTNDQLAIRSCAAECLTQP